MTRILILGDAIDARKEEVQVSDTTNDAQ